MYRRGLGLGYYANFFLGCTVLYTHMTTRVYKHDFVQAHVLSHVQTRTHTSHIYTCGKMCTIWTLIFAGF